MYVSHRIFERILRLTSVRQACLSVSVFSHSRIHLFMFDRGVGSLISSLEKDKFAEAQSLATEAAVYATASAR